MNQLKDKISVMKYVVLIAGVCTTVAPVVSAFYTKIHNDDALYRSAWLLSFLGALTVVLTQVKQTLDERQNKTKEDDFRKKLDLAHAQQLKAVADVADANRRAHKSEEEFRLYMTGGDAAPKLRIIAFENKNFKEIGLFTQLQVDIKTLGKYPLHNVSIQVLDPYGHYLYSKIRIKRTLHHISVPDTSARTVSYAEYTSEQSSHFPILRTESNYVPIYTACYPLTDEAPNLKLTITITWGAGTKIYMIPFYRTLTRFDMLAEIVEVYQDNMKLIDPLENHVEFQIRNF